MRATAVLGSVALLLVAGCSDPVDDHGHTSSSTASGGGQVRTHYVQADEVTWDYAPAGRNGVTGGAFGVDEQVFVTPATDRIGSRYTKCVYRGYDDPSFTTLQERPADEAYLGLLGPVIRAEVGDTIRVVFRNRCGFPTSMHPHGVLYDKSAEGAGYADGTVGRDRADDAVAPGGSHTYTWEVPERAGPAEMDGSSVMWMYHSHNDEVAQTNAGLMGAMVVTAKGRAKADGSPEDVDRELFALFSVMDENASPYLHRNRERLTAPPAADDGGFQESNLMHAVNGYVYANGPVPRLRSGERVRWYVMSMGTEVDLHTPHWHGNTVVTGGMRMDSVSLLPAEMTTADMRPDAVGRWLFHCHVNDHITAGMQAMYEVTG